jgi:hypothetical protein
MAPAFYIDNTATMAVTDIQWISPTESSFQRLTGPTTLASYDFDRSDVYVNPYYDRTPKKEETRKERLIRWATAFKIFYPPKPDLILIKTENDELARYRESFKRRLKFKGQNRNLII